jgi:adenylate cyclase
MDILHLLEYFPIDRWHALASGSSLPERSTGACLFADISGFTVLTEMLRMKMGARQGAEELSRQINRVYDALVEQVRAFHGVVISFAGDAITCWFDDNHSDGSLRATQCALNLQLAMRQFQPIVIREDIQAEMGLKVAVATGMTRNFVVGDPNTQLIAALVGQTLVRMTDGEHLANRGDVILDPVTIDRLGARVQISERRTDDHSGLVYGVATGLEPPLASIPWEQIDTNKLEESMVKQWLLPPVYERLKANAGDFLTEMRPCVVFFLRFEGIDYETDPEAGNKLDRVVRMAQDVLNQYGGWVLQLTIGDKGSYLYGCVGAPIAYEDSAFRMCRAMLELRFRSLQSTDIHPVQIGIASGILRTGAYGASIRKTYGVLGDEVNLSARLMQAAVPGEILVSEPVYRVVADRLHWDAMTPIHVKGKRDAISIYRLLADDKDSTLDLLEPKYALPMIGRTAELAQMMAVLGDSRQSSGHMVLLMAEAGMGKSRLIAEFSRQTLALGHHVYGGVCPSWGTLTAWLVWKFLLRAYFHITPSQPIDQQINQIETTIRELDNTLLERIPLLNDILSLEIPDTAFTSLLEPNERKSALEAFVLTLLQKRVFSLQQEKLRLVLVLEDVHWVDPSSQEFLSYLVQHFQELPIMIVAVQRVPPKPIFVAQERVLHIILSVFSPDEMRQLIALKLKQHYSNEQMELDEAFYNAIINRAEGNPFYIEELLNYLYDEQLTLTDVTLEDIPTSLIHLILSRIDRLSERQRLTLKVASIIGRMFDLRRLSGYYPELGCDERLLLDLTYLSELEITPLDQEEPEIVYLFKHILTQEVTYTSLTQETRAVLHEQFATYLETQDDLDRTLDLITFHYGLSNNRGKKIRYFELSGQSAAARFANSEAIYFYSQALSLLSADNLSERYALLSARERLYYHTGLADNQLADIQAMQAVARLQNDTVKLAESHLRQAYHDKLTSNYLHASQTLSAALTQVRSEDAPAIVAEVYCELAQALFFLGNLNTARIRASEGLLHTHLLTRQHGQLHRTLGMIDIRQGKLDSARSHLQQALSDLQNNITDRAFVIADLANLAFIDSDFKETRRLLTESLHLSKLLGNSVFTRRTLITLAAVIGVEGTDLPSAQTYLQEALLLTRQTGDRNGECHVLNNLGFNAMLMGQYAEAEADFQQALDIALETQSKSEIALLLNNRAIVAVSEGRYADARTLFDESIVLKQEIDDPIGIAESETYLAWIAMEEGYLENAIILCQQSIERATAVATIIELARAWYLKGRIHLLQRQYELARESFHNSLNIRRDSGMDFATLEPYAGLALVGVGIQDASVVQQAMEYIQSALKGRSPSGLEDPIFVYWGWWQAQAFQGPTTDDRILQTAFNLIIDRSNHVTTTPDLSTYLEKVNINRLVITEWETRHNNR